LISYAGVGVERYHWADEKDLKSQDVIGRPETWDLQRNCALLWAYDYASGVVIISADHANLTKRVVETTQKAS
jgi:hypothetical protein